MIDLFSRIPDEVRVTEDGKGIFEARYNGYAGFGEWAELAVRRCFTLLRRQKVFVKDADREANRRQAGNALG